ncbi:MAG: DNA polymerase III subunit beta [Alphaproteobacteria bacterium]|nr:DNA polymerase III subunit beta [Alphaproteobacteria bacterium]
MKFIVERAFLLKSLSHVQSIVEKSQTIPVLANVLMETIMENDGGKLYLHATDNEIEISEQIPVEVSEGGKITVVAHLLYDIIKKLPEGSQVEISLNPEENVMKIKSGKAKFSLPTLPAEGFPLMQQEPSAKTFTLTTAELQGLIERTQFAVSVEETRYNLNGIYLHEFQEEGKEKRLKAVATDGHRLACVEMKLPKEAEDLPGIIIPRKTISEINKLAGEILQDVTISISQNQIRFSLGDVVLTSRLIDGTYPDYQRVIPVGNDKVMITDAEELKKVVDRVSVVSEKTKAIKMALKRSSVMVYASNVDEGSAEDEIEASYDQETMDIGFNYRYLLEILGQIKSTKVRFTLMDGTAPVIVQDVEDPSALYVLMPMRV